MKRNLLVTVAAGALLSSATVGAQTDADNFYKSDQVNTEKVSFLPKELLIVPGAEHVDLYDRTNLIPFDKLESFFKKYLNPVK